MARKIQGSIRKVTETRVFDEEGREIYTGRYSQETVHDPQDGSVTTCTEAESTTLTTGETYHPGMSNGPNPIMLTGICEACRDSNRWPWSGRRTHGLTNAQHLKHCHDCGMPLCPRHRRQSRIDRKWRCLKDHRRHMLKHYLRCIFLEDE